MSERSHNVLVKGDACQIHSWLVFFLVVVGVLWECELTPHVLLSPVEALIGVEDIVVHAEVGHVVVNGVIA